MLFIASKALSSQPGVVHVNHRPNLFISFRAQRSQPWVIHVLYKVYFHLESHLTSHKDWCEIALNKMVSLKHKFFYLLDQMEGRKWEHLNMDCLVNVFQRVGMESLLLDIPFVCKSWHKASRDPQCWEYLIFPEYTSNLMIFGRKTALTSPLWKG